MIRKILISLRKRGIVGMLQAGISDMLHIAGKRLALLRDHCSTHRFIERSSGKSKLIVILAGYKPYLWPVTLVRLEKYAPKNADFCVASAGIFSDKLEKICAKNGWSYLSVGRNSPGVALNKAILLHPEADYIYKLDEDIIIGKGFFEQLYEGYQSAWKYSLLEPGFCAPILNVNGISYQILLHELNLESEYRNEFGPIFTRCDNLPVHNNPHACWWLWRNILPFYEKVEYFSRLTGRYSVCATRFSIGAILFRRGFINKIGGFKSDWKPGVLGVDENQLCRDCTSESRPMYIIESVLAGHFSFYPQEKLMRTKLPEMSRLDPVTFPPGQYTPSDAD